MSLFDIKLDLKKRKDQLTSLVSLSLNSFNEVLATLSKIPILPGLLASAVESIQGGDGNSKDGDISEAVPAVPQENSSSTMSTAPTADETEPMAVSKKSNNSCGEDWQRQHEEKAVTLLQWISTKDNQSTLEQMVDQCGRGLDQVALELPSSF